jgi:hypothetical protein
MSASSPPASHSTASSRCFRCIGIVVLAYGFVAEPRTVVDHMRVLTDVLPPDIALLIGEQAADRRHLIGG